MAPFFNEATAFYQAVAGSALLGLSVFFSGWMSGNLIKRGWSLGAARKALVVFGGVGVTLLIPTILTTNLYLITLLFALSTFAYACNSRNQRHVAQQCQITYVAPGKLGMLLTAEAQERHRADRSGIYDITVRDESGTVIAEFRGHSRSIPGTLVEGA